MKRVLNILCIIMFFSLSLSACGKSGAKRVKGGNYVDMYSLAMDLKEKCFYDFSFYLEYPDYLSLSDENLDLFSDDNVSNGIFFIIGESLVNVWNAYAISIFEYKDELDKKDFLPADYDYKTADIFIKDNLLVRVEKGSVGSHTYSIKNYEIYEIVIKHVFYKGKINELAEALADKYSIDEFYLRMEEAAAFNSLLYRIYPDGSASNKIKYALSFKASINGYDCGISFMEFNSAKTVNKIKTYYEFQEEGNGFYTGFGGFSTYKIKGKKLAECGTFGQILESETAEIKDILDFVISTL